MLIAVAALMEAAICFRLGGHESRCRIWCPQSETEFEFDELLFDRETFHALATLTECEDEVVSKNRNDADGALAERSTAERPSARV